ncbi:class I SAM-dependent methyltransferase [Methylocapsa sp. S129]|uniref:class I SAM-dependent methyltransferase n=1 Tax=Methylocapsa sp. S129 TaxID=1641869 RepID=UPI00131EAC8F|nr:SAM-dependent methyltransferase [Methylocapsa sp. S129]
MSALGDEIKALIGQEGPISLERYMALALTHPTHGYYMKRDPFGAEGDFTTAPEISQMFGELLGLWAAEVWTAMDSPNPLRLIEFGPGRGTLMSDALRASRVAPDFRAALDVCLIETSPTLAAVQHDTLLTAGAAVSWAAQLDEAPDGPAIMIANEFLDALPIRQYVRGPRGWCERQVGLDSAGNLAFGLSPEPERFIKAQAQEGDVLEVGAVGHRLMFALGARLARQGGAALFIDYGHTATGFGDTLQALRAHRMVDPLTEPGEADITAHVDFAAMARSARAAGAVVYGPIDQGDFLKVLGLDQRAQALISRAGAAQAADVEAARERLSGKSVGGMGALFKVMAVAHRQLPVPPGFHGLSGAAA